MSDVGRAASFPRSNRLQKGIRWAELATGGSGVALAVLVALSSAALGVTFNSINHVAPYRGAIFSANNQVVSICASKNRFGVTPTWNNGTGIGGWTSLSFSKSCVQALGGTSAGYAGTFLSIAIPIHVPNGGHSVQVNANVVFTASQSLHLGGLCPAPHLVNGNGYEQCTLFSQWCFSGCFYGPTPYLWDATNNTFVYSSTTFPVHNNYTEDYNYTTCSSNSCTYSNGTTSVKAQSTVNTPFTWYFNSTMVKSHKYWAVISFNGFAYSSVMNYPASTATASLNFGSFGNGFNVTSVTVV